MVEQWKAVFNIDALKLIEVVLIAIFGRKYSFKL
jgi:hypothetical protein